MVYTLSRFLQLTTFIQWEESERVTLLFHLIGLKNLHSTKLSRIQTTDSILSYTNTKRTVRLF